MAKIVLVGDKAVGKTSLIRRYVVDAFDDRYLSTLGAKVTKKVMEVRVPGKDVIASLSLNIWDIMGQASFRELAKEAYFHGASGVIVVVDLTRRETLDGIAEWVRAVRDVARPASVVVAGNKYDLAGQAAVSPPELVEAAKAVGGAHFLTSAKTGENVEAAFAYIANEIGKAYLDR